MNEEQGGEEKTTRVGPYDVQRTPESLTLRLDNSGDISIKGCLFFLVGMTCILFVALFSVIQSADNQNTKSPTDPSHMMGLYTNQSGFIWMILTGLMVIILPIYLSSLQKSATVLFFNRQDQIFRKNGKEVTSFARIENLQIKEVYDPDRRFLYEVELFYGDGYSLFLHNTYEEREAGNFAKEIASYIPVPVIWKSQAGNPASPSE
jgi:hypothetical protein